MLLAENKEEMRSMIERLEGYLDGKRMELNADKTKKSDLGKGKVGKVRKSRDGRIM